MRYKTQWSEEELDYVQRLEFATNAHANSQIPIWECRCKREYEARVLGCEKTLHSCTQEEITDAILTMASPEPLAWHDLDPLNLTSYGYHYTTSSQI